MLKHRLWPWTREISMLELHKNEGSRFTLTNDALDAMFLELSQAVTGVLYIKRADLRRTPSCELEAKEGSDMARSARDHKNAALYALILRQMHHPCGYCPPPSPSMRILRSIRRGTIALTTSATSIEPLQPPVNTSARSTSAESLKPNLIFNCRFLEIFKIRNSDEKNLSMQNLILDAMPHSRSFSARRSKRRRERSLHKRKT
jgi:hypothetical protein